MATLRKLAFIVDEFVVGEPSQQLLDRFLIGYSGEGEFRRVPNLQVTIWAARSTEKSNSALLARRRDHNLIIISDLAAAVREADAVVVAPPLDRVVVSEELLAPVLQHPPKDARCFVYGCLAENGARARHFLSRAEEGGLIMATGTTMATSFRLPDVEIVAGTPLTEALVVVQGKAPTAELAGFEGLLPFISQRPGGETGLRAVRRLMGNEFWRALREPWVKSLLAAALSRSNTAQGDGLRDGRTQDLLGQGLVKKLARQPRGWLLEHRDGFRSAVVVLDGVVADTNFAVRSRGGALTSAQLYRPPAPNRCEFDPFVGVLVDFFQTAKRPWAAERSVMMAEFMERLRASA